MASTVQARAIISATDNASGVFKSVAAAGQQAMRTLNQSNGVFGQLKNNMGAVAHKMQSTAALTMAMPSALSIGNLGHNQYEWDRALHTFNAITEISPGEMDGLKKSIVGISNATGVSSLELVAAAKGWVELGNSPKTFIENAEVAARTSRIVGVSVAEQMKESSALLRAFKGSEWKQDDFKHFEEVYLVASKGMKGGAHAFGEAMKMWAPVAASLGLTVEQASAFAQTLGGQFGPTEIGNALKTGFMRLSAPTPKSAGALRYAGINEATLYTIDKNKLDAARMAEGFRGAGLKISPATQQALANEIARADLSKGTNGLQDGLNKVLTQALGRKTKTGGYVMNAQDSKVVQAAVLNVIGMAKTGLNPKEFFKQFSPYANDLAFMQQVFGKEHASKIMDLLKQGEHWLHNYEKILHDSEGALGRKWSIFGEGFAYQWDKVTASWDNLMKSVGGGAVANQMTGIMAKMSSAFTAMQSMDPNTVLVIFDAIAAIALLPVLAIGITSFSVVVGALVSPVGLATAAIAGLGLAIYKIYENWGDIKAAFGGSKEAADRVLGKGKYAPDDGTRDGGWHNSPKFRPLSYQMKLGPDDALNYFDINKGVGSVWSTMRSIERNYNTSSIPGWSNATDNVVAEAQREAERLRARSPSMQFARDVDPNAGPRTVDVTGRVQADVNGTVTGIMQGEIKITAPDGLSAAWSRRPSGDVRGSLNTGRSMPDTGGSAAP